jgi:hypothetical protein
MRIIVPFLFFFFNPSCNCGCFGRHVSRRCFQQTLVFGSISLAEPVGKFATQSFPPLLPRPTLSSFRAFIDPFAIQYHETDSIMRRGVRFLGPTSALQTVPRSPLVLFELRQDQKSDVQVHPRSRLNKLLGHIFLARIDLWVLLLDNLLQQRGIHPLTPSSLEVARMDGCRHRVRVIGVDARAPKISFYAYSFPLVSLQPGLGHAHGIGAVDLLRITPGRQQIRLDRDIELRSKWTMAVDGRYRWIVQEGA